MTHRAAKLRGEMARMTPRACGTRGVMNAAATHLHREGWLLVPAALPTPAS
ncbi:MAG: hypothetical protein M3Z24_02650 [Chloroflexota bacterium]|nr:hypothetical protein [Chloroflexota bacterium]